MIKIGVCGAAGRMGKTIVATIHETDGVALGAAIEHSASPALGKDAGRIAGIDSQGILLNDRISAVVADVDVWIDFTTAAAVLDNLHQCRTAGRPVVIGATAIDQAQLAEVRAAAADIAIVLAPNMSIGVNLMFRLTQLAAEIIGGATDIEIIEAHHKHKQDAPSGTAVRLGEISAAALGRDMAECAVYDRAGQTGARDAGTIGFASIRAGDIVGEHSVLFAGAGERLEIKHIATSRRTFADGALRAAVWLMQKRKGLYDMQDVLGLRQV